mmetsp:Transcript_66634/g.119943  ORF Transcript_66634/g.119943 Transcript_66634/m.119943 type:complete len:235 (-) Transcript_66634:1104-1808(-)
MATPAETRRTWGSRSTTSASSSFSWRQRDSSSRSIEDTLRSACCSSMRAPAPPSSSAPPASTCRLRSSQCSTSCTTASLQSMAARHCAVTRCSKASRREIFEGQSELLADQVSEPTERFLSSWTVSSRSPFSSSCFSRRWRSALARSMFFRASISSALRSSSWRTVSRSLSSQDCFMNRSMSWIWVSYRPVSATPEACSASFARRASTSSMSFAICSASSFFVALTLMVFARLA